MDMEDAKKVIRDIVRFNWIRITTRCDEAMDERRLTMDDLLQAILWGRILEIEPGPFNGDWKCVMEGLDTEQRKLVINVLVLDGGMALVCLDATEKGGK